MLNRRSFVCLGLASAFALAGCASVRTKTGTKSSQQTGSSSKDAPGSEIAVAELPRTITLNSGYEMPTQGLGTYSLDFATCVGSIHSLASSGGRLIDTAYMYHNEDAVGEGVRTCGVPREELFVTTKLYPNQFADPERAIQQALDTLDIGYIDLLLLHHPGAGDVEAYKAMEKAVAAGTVRSIGLSNWYVEELEDFLPKVDTVPALVQNEIHPYYQGQGVVPYIQDLGIAMQGWYPLGGRGHNTELLADSTLRTIADAHGVSIPQVILRWNRQRGIIVIPGSGNPDHIAEDLNIHGFALSDDEMQRITALDRHEKHDWY
ncbi:MAG: aldo/keto reductase [Eggerthellaceae bacterium]|nr:aldo/keto reductase [Eggerthellaceae bacterium]